MSRTFIRQDTQIRNSDAYDDTITPNLANFETNPTHIESDLNNIRSQLSNFLDIQAGNWYDTVNTPGTFENGAQRGINGLNTDLHELERKRVLKCVTSLLDVTVPATQNFVVLGTGELPGNTTAAVGAVTTLGSVVAAHSGTFGTHSLDEVAGSTPIGPKNLLEIVDGATRDPILDSGGERIWALIQSENATDGHTITDTTPNRVQLSFVVINGAGDDLVAAAVADIENAVINYCYVERVGLDDLNEEDFLRGAAVDIPSAANVTRQGAYDNQGPTPVDLTTTATLDLETAGISWIIRDDLEAALFTITEGSAGGTSTMTIGSDVDVYQNDAVDVDFNSGIQVDEGGQTINLGTTSGQIDSAATLKLLASGGTSNLQLEAGQDLQLTDGNRAGSTWSLTTGINLSDASTEWDDFETAFGEVSLLNAIVQASKGENRTKGVAVVTSTASAGTNVTGVGGGANLDAQLPAYDHVASFQDDVDVYLNGVLMRGDNSTTGANDHDVYPGDTPANGDLKFEFTVKGTGANPDVITMIVYGEP